MWLSEGEKKLTEEYLTNGYCIRKVNDLKVLNQIIDIFVELAEKITEVKCKTSKSDYLNNIHNIVTVDN